MICDGIGPTPAAVQPVRGPDPVGPDEPTASLTVLALSDVALRRDGRALLRGIDWRVEQGQHWILLGANGSGKTSLVRIASLVEHPSRVGSSCSGNASVRPTSAPCGDGSRSSARRSSTSSDPASTLSRS